MDPETQIKRETYESPVITEYGALIELARGGGSDDYDGCSSNRYDVDDDEDE